MANNSDFSLEELAAKVEELEAELDQAVERLRLLAISKLTHPRYTYYAWLVEHEVDEETRFRLERVLVALGSRARGDAATPPGGDPLADFGFGSGPLGAEEVIRVLKQTLEVSNPRQVWRLIFALQGQTMFQDVIESLGLPID